ncbi:hypothetical protein JCM1840_003381 [Sporobolomyces johnsonii]
MAQASSTHSQPATSDPAHPSATPAGPTQSPAHSRGSSSSFGGSDASATSQTPLLCAEGHHRYSSLSTSSTSSSEVGQGSKSFDTVLEEDLQKRMELCREHNSNEQRLLRLVLQKDATAMAILIEEAASAGQHTPQDAVAKATARIGLLKSDKMAARLADDENTGADASNEEGKAARGGADDDRRTAVEVQRLEREEQMKVLEGQMRTKWMRTTVAISGLVALLSAIHLPVALTVLLSTAIAALGLYITASLTHSLTLDFLSSSHLSQPRSPPEHAPQPAIAAKFDEPYESSEWLNTVLASLWPIVDRSLFAAGVDLLEDTMLELSPPMIHSVRVTSVEQGSHPVRVLGIRTIPSSLDSLTTPAASPAPDLPTSTDQGDFGSPPIQTGQYGYVPRPSPWTADPGEEHNGASSLPHQSRSSGSVFSPDPAHPGPYVGLEIDFGYRQKPSGRGSETRSDEAGDEVPGDGVDEMHFVVYLGLGVSSVLTFPVPVLITLAGLRGTVRLRLQLVPEPPFVKTLAFSLPKTPEIQLRAHPLEGPIDIMTLPFLNSYVLKSVQAVAERFVAPKTYALDLRKILLGGDVALKTRTIGLIVLVLHGASSLPAADRPFPVPLPARARSRTGGKSDPFVEVGFAGFGKILHKSRIVVDSLDPVWEEMCFIRIASEPVEDDAKIRLNVIDHDRFGRNDALGFVDFPIRALHDRPGEWTHRTEKLRQVVGTRKGGDIEYSAAYFPLARVDVPSAQANTPAEQRSAQLGENNKHEKDGEQHEKEDMMTCEAGKNRRLAGLNELLEGRHPAPVSHPSGILAFQIHQIADLELDKSPSSVKSALRDVHLKPGKGNRRLAKDLPSCYVDAVVNDGLVFQTRLKPFSNAPYFNTGSESFIRDWPQSKIVFAAMDRRDRDHDVLIGYVSIKLTEVLKDRSQASKWYRLEGGAGNGRIRISLLFKPLAMDLAPGLREWSVGTLEVLDAKVTGVFEGVAARLAFKLEKGASRSTHVVDTRSSEVNSTSTDLHFDLRAKPLILPVLSRVASVQIELQSMHSLKRNVPFAQGVFWISAVSRGDPTTITVELSDRPPRRIPNPHPLPQLKATTLADEPSRSASRPSPRSSLSPSPSPDPVDPSAPSRPTLVLTLRWRPGFSPAHSHVVLGASSAARASYQLWLHMQDHEAEQRREEREQEGEGGEGDEDGEGWEEEDEEEEGEDGGMDEIDEKRDGKRARKGGTWRWMAHGAKIAAHKIRSARQHHLREPEPETELQSAL